MTHIILNINIDGAIHSTSLEKEITFGRKRNKGKSKAQYLIEDPDISTLHLKITFDKALGKIFFEDLKSTNGTFLNGQQNKEDLFHINDVLKIGRCTISIDKSSLSRELKASIEKRISYKHGKQINLK